MLCFVCRFGDITQVHIVRDPGNNMCKGFCFISFDNKEQAGQAKEGKAQHCLRLRPAVTSQNCGPPLVRHVRTKTAVCPWSGMCPGGPGMLASHGALCRKASVCSVARMRMPVLAPTDLC
jgi:hypothetical protein